MSREATSRVVYPSAFAMPLILGLVTGLLSIALVTAQSALSLLCMLVLFTAVCARLWSLFSLAHVSCRLSVDKARSFVGEQIELRAHVDNDKLLPIWLQLGVPVSDAARTLEGAAGLLSYQRARLRWQVSLPRGVHKLGPVELLTSDPLGFFTQHRAMPGIELIVYPRMVPILPFGLLRRDLLGHPSPDSQIDDPTYLSGVREYQGGLAARYIDWKASARAHRLLEKLFERSSHERVLFVLRAEHFANDRTHAAFERAIETLASWAVALDRDGMAVGFATNCALNGSKSFMVRPGRARGQLAQMLELLARAQPRVAGNATPLIQRVPSSALTTLVFFVYELDADHHAWLQRCSARQRTVNVLCRPDAEASRDQLPVGAHVTSLHAISGEALTWGASA